MVHSKQAKKKREGNIIKYDSECNEVNIYIYIYIYIYICDIAFPIWFSCLWASPGRYAHAPAGIRRYDTIMYYIQCMSCIILYSHRLL